MSVVPVIVSFLESIGIPVIARELDEATFLPGITIDGGALVYDPARLTYPGDLLHEAGHIAMTPAEDRPRLSSSTPFTLGDDMGAIAWSYAALLHLGLDPTVVFHEGGYFGSSRAYIENFAAGRYVGVPFLEWAGLTYEPRPRGRAESPTFPAMIKWLRGAAHPDEEVRGAEP